MLDGVNVKLREAAEKFPILRCASNGAAAGLSLLSCTSVAPVLNGWAHGMQERDGPNTIETTPRAADSSIGDSVLHAILDLVGDVK